MSTSLGIVCHKSDSLVVNDVSIRVHLTHEAMICSRIEVGFLLYRPHPTHVHFCWTDEKKPPQFYCRSSVGHLTRSKDQHAQKDGHFQDGSRASQTLWKWVLRKTLGPCVACELSVVSLVICAPVLRRVSFSEISWLTRCWSGVQTLESSFTSRCKENREVQS